MIAGRNVSGIGFARYRYRVFAKLFLFYFFCLLPKSVAQEDAPLINRPAANFYNARGSVVKVAWSVDRQSVPEDGELTATLTIAGADNSPQIDRPDLKKLPEFQTRFVITDRNDPSPSERAAEVKFSYLLRPRNRAVDKLPRLEFYFYNPTASDGKKQFPLAIARAVPITVTEAPKLEPPLIPLREPDRLFVVTTGEQSLEKQKLFITGFWPWLIVGLSGPFCALLWFLAWQRIFPDAVKLASMRRSRAARRAIDAIRRASRTDDPPATIAAAALSYLRTRFPLPHWAVTPSEIETSLGELKVSPSECIAVAKFFRSCDEARFAPPSDNGASLATDAEALIARLELA
jgi:hypothetical protein